MYVHGYSVGKGGGAFPGQTTKSVTEEEMVRSTEFLALLVIPFLTKPAADSRLLTFHLSDGRL